MRTLTNPAFGAETDGSKLGLTEDELLSLGVPLRSVFLRRRSPLYLSYDRLYQIQSGRVKISRVSTEGREVILDFVEPGELFGEMEVLDAHQDTTAEALEDSRVMAIPRRRLEALLLERPELAIRFARLVALRRNRAETRLLTLAYNTVPRRLGNVLLQLCRRYGTPHPRGSLLRIRLSQKELGSLIGASREIVNLTLSDFRQKGLVEVSRSQIIVREQELSSELAQSQGKSFPRAMNLEAYFAPPARVERMDAASVSTSLTRKWRWLT